MQKVTLNKNENLEILFKKYISNRSTSGRLREETLRGYKEAFKVFTQLMPQVRVIDDLTEDNLNIFFERLNTRKRTISNGEVRTGVKDSTIKTYWSKLNSFFYWLEERELILHSPLKYIKPPKVRYEDARELTKGEFNKIVSSICIYSNNSLMKKRDLAIMYVLFFCGVRKGELLGLQISDIDFDKRILTIRAETSKSRATRKMPMHSVLIEQLKDYLDGRKKQNYKTEKLFVSNNEDKGLTEHGLKHLIKKLSENSGVRFHLHKLRHSFACNLARAGIKAYNLQKLMGHTDMRMTERYLRSMNVEDYRSDIEKLSIENMA